MNCTHDNTRTTELPKGSMHFARVDCNDCQRFVKWLPFPETLIRQEENARRVKTLQGMPQDTWTQGFLASFPKKPSPKQQAVLDKKWEEKGK